MRVLSRRCGGWVTVLLSATALGDGYEGCGTLTPPVACGGCFPQSGSCQCLVTACVQSSYQCTGESAGWTRCNAPGTFSEIWSMTTWCKRRKACNNSLGVDLGSCAADAYCVESEPWVYFGAERHVYFEMDECTCPITCGGDRSGVATNWRGEERG